MFFRQGSDGRFGIDRLSGTEELRKQIIAGKTEQEMRESWEPELSQFKEIRKKYLLYK